MQGARGSPGPRGEKGMAGNNGPQGRDGATGDTGIEGERGATGQAGAQGATGPPGQTGSQGVQGPKGPRVSALIFASVGSTNTLGTCLLLFKYIIQSDLCISFYVDMRLSVVQYVGIDHTGAIFLKYRYAISQTNTFISIC